MGRNRALRRSGRCSRTCTAGFEPEFGFQLWDGSTIPEDWPSDGLALAIADEGVIGGLLKAPNITLDRQSLGGGAHRSEERDAVRSGRPQAEGAHARTAQVARHAQDGAGVGAVPVRSARRTLAARAYRPRSGERRNRGREPAQHRLSLRRLQRLLCAVARPGHGLHLRLLPRLGRGSRHGATAEARHDLPEASASARGPDARHRLRLGLARLPRGRCTTARMSSA